MKKQLLLASFICLCFAFISWGRTGHEAIALIAENHLTPQAKAAITELLNGQSLADVSNWADEVRDDPEFRSTSPWHYVNEPVGLSFDQFAMDVATSHKGNVYNALIRSEHVLSHTDNTLEKRVEALKFIIHLIGDAHQPMHVSRAEDQGGNLISIRFNKVQSNLHALWDSKLIDHQGLSYEQMAKSYDTASPRQIRQWQSDDMLKWLYESYQISTKLYAEMDQNKILDNTYYDQHIDIVKQRIAMAGIRLAGVLNDCFRNEQLAGNKVLAMIPRQSISSPPNWSNAEVSLNDLSKHIGKLVSVQGKIFGFKELQNMTLIDLGASYPNQLATIVFNGDEKDDFITYDSVGKLLMVIGIVSNYKGKPQIVINDHRYMYISK